MRFKKRGSIEKKLIALTSLLILIVATFLFLRITLFAEENIAGSYSIEKIGKRYNINLTLEQDDTNNIIEIKEKDGKYIPKKTKKLKSITRKRTGGSLYLQGASKPDFKFTIKDWKGDKITTQVIVVEQLNVNKATITLAKYGNVDQIMRCADLTVDASECTDWIPTDIEFTDNGDTISFEVTEFSGYAGASIDILNVQSYPTLYGNWTVRFATNGIADLTITAAKDPDYSNETTTWSNTNENEDLKFLQIKCGDNILDYQWTDNSVFIENYNCNETGYEISKVLTAKKHVLKFQFGDEIEYAYNDVPSEIPNPKALIVWDDRTPNTIGQYRIWNGTNYSDEANTIDLTGTSYPLLIEMAVSPESGKKQAIFASMDVTNKVHFQIWNGTNWTNTLTSVVSSIYGSGAVMYRSLDVQYWNNTHALAVWWDYDGADPDADSTISAYAIWNGTGWTDNLNTPDWTGADSPRQQELDCYTPNEECILVQTLYPANAVWAGVWNGTDWDIRYNTSILDGTNGGDESHYSVKGIDVEYDDNGNAMIIASNYGTDTVQYRIWNSTGFEPLKNATSDFGADPYFVELAKDPNSNEMALIAVDVLNDVHVAIWNGTDWGNEQEVGTNTAYNYFDIDIAYDINGNAMAVFSNLTATYQIDYIIWNGSSWQNPGQAIDMAGPTLWYPNIRLVADPNSDEMILTDVDTSHAVHSQIWNGSAWGNSLTLDAAGHYYSRSSDVVYFTEAGPAPLANNPPNDPAPQINSTDGTNLTTQDLNCNGTITDPDAGDLINVTVVWYNNSIPYLSIDYNDSYASGTAFNAVLNSANTTEGENWTCGMRLNDGEDYSNWANSSNLTIKNTAPNNPAPQINSTDGTNLTTQDLNCNDTLIDPDPGDLINVTVVWYNNSIPYLSIDYNDSYASGTAFNAVLNSANTTEGENWTCGMRLNDGEDYSNWANSSNLTILDSTTCINASDSLLINESTYLCNGTFNLADSDDDGIIIANNDSITITCLGTKIVEPAYNPLSKGFNLNQHTNVTLKNCYIDGYYYAAYAPSASHDNNLSNNTLINNNYAFQDINSHGIIIENSNITGSSTRCLDIVSSDRIKIKNNILDSCTQEAISSIGMHGIVENNIIRNGGGTNYYAITTSTETNITIKNNTINTYGGGIYFRSNYGKVINNALNDITSSSTKYGLNIDHATGRNLIENNTINDSSSIAIYLSTSANNIFKNMNLTNNKYDLVVEGSTTLANYNQSFIGFYLSDGREAFYNSSISNKVFDGATDNIGFVGCYKCNNITIKNTKTTKTHGAILADTNNSEINNITFSDFLCTLTGCRGIYFQDSQFNIINNSNGSSYQETVYFHNADDNNITNNNFDSSNNEAVYLSSSANTLIETNYNITGSGYGVATSSSGSTVTIINNNQYISGIYLQNADNSKVTNNHNISGGTRSIYVNSADDVLIDNNSNISDNFIYILSSNRVNITNNEFRHCDNYNIYLSTADFAYIANNEFYNGGGCNGIYMYNTQCDSNTIFNNTFHSFTNSEPLVQIRGTNHKVINNTFRARSTRTIVLNGASDSNITGNIISNFTNRGIYFDSLSPNNIIKNNIFNYTGALAGVNVGAIVIQNANGNIFRNNSINGINHSFDYYFPGSDTLKIMQEASPNPDPTGKDNISKYLDIVSTTADTWIFLNISYTDDEISHISDESTLQILRYNGTDWEPNSTVYGVVTDQNYVYANITTFSDFGVFGDEPGNNPPNDPTPYINSTYGTNFSTEDLNCNATITDPDAGDKINVTIIWYNNSALHLWIDYNESYASGTVFNAVLNSANTSVGENWTCEMRLNDGEGYSNWVNSTNLTILPNSNITINATDSCCALEPTFSANFTNRTGDFESGALCNITIDGQTIKMSLNDAGTLYINDTWKEEPCANQNIIHEFPYNISCYKPGYDLQEDNSTVNVYHGTVGDWICGGGPEGEIIPEFNLIGIILIIIIAAVGYMLTSLKAGHKLKKTKSKKR